MKIGIALSGGAVRGAAHIGVLKALEERGIKPDFISGSSAGSIVGAFYAAGYSPLEMEKIALNTKFLSYLKPELSFSALFSLEKLEKFLERYIGKKDISELEKKLFVCVTNLNKGIPEYKSKGDLFLWISASSSLPFIFKPVEYEGNLYIDGGIMDNLPVEPLKIHSDYIIGVDVNPLGTEERLNNAFSILIRSFYLAFRSNVELRKRVCDLFIQPEDLVDIGLFSAWRIKDAIDIGYRYTKNILNRNDLKI
ncbi:MAG TPA: Patatin [Persephonella sp.]|uniref:Patatin n=1 Tax=Persephonella marina (strain DSM 14350 / EX-H1) TaxID=123214 RepID=C0QQ19_PERMH|nr:MULTISPECIES: patatin-like phospholipase family protein [Persephonella]ACO03557.1 patatin [Persephonella marina EX-H1]HCB69620.1 Patatin [Persephonella sp.]